MKSDPNDKDVIIILLGLFLGISIALNILFVCVLGRPDEEDDEDVMTAEIVVTP